MPKTKTKRSISEVERTLRDACLARAKRLGYGSLLALCVDRKVDYTLVQRALRRGAITRRTGEGTVVALRSLGFEDLFRTAV